MMLVDSHAHLDSAQFREDLAEVLSRAEEAEITAILTIGCLDEDPETGPNLLKLLESKPYLYGAFGVHPHDARLFDSEMKEKLIGLMEHPKVIGLGEVGLDYYYTHSPRDVQLRVFREQLHLARTLNKPVIIHTRDSEEETMRVLEEEFTGSEEDVGIMHCFAGSWQMAVRSISLGFLISFGGILTFKNAEGLRETAIQLPEERLLIETDSPYLAPVPNRGKRNEPAYVKWVARQLGELRGTSTEEIVSATGMNFRRLFGIREVVG